MNTCCRTAALRIFVRSITQIHVPATATATANRLPQCYSALSRTHRYSNLQRVLGALDGRQPISSLHTSCAGSNAEAAAHAPAVRETEGGPTLGLSGIRETATSDQPDAHSSTESTKPAENRNGAAPGPSGKWAKKKARRERELAERIARGETIPEEKEPRKVSREETRQNDAKAPVRADRPEPKKNGLWARKKMRLARAQAVGGSSTSEAATGTATAKRGEGRTTLAKQREARDKTVDGPKVIKNRWSEERKEKEREKRKAERKKAKEADKWVPPPKEPWMEQKITLKEKFPEGWAPRKKLSPDALSGIRALHAQFPTEFTTAKLAEKFEVSPEAIRRILKTKWTPSVEEEEDRQNRWFNRGKRVWAQWAEIGRKPPAKWRAEGVTRHPIWNRPKAERGRVRVSARSRTAVRIDGSSRPSLDDKGKLSMSEGILMQKNLANSFKG